MRPKNGDPFNLAVKSNDLTFVNTFLRLEEIAINRFKWKGLPHSVDERFLELVLFNKGYCLFFDDETFGYMTLTCNFEGIFNPYNIPTRYHAYAPSGFYADRDISNSVLIYNNYLRMPSFSVIWEYAERIAEVQRVIDINAKAQKTPVLILCDEENLLSMKNLYMQYEGNYPVIYGRKGTLISDDFKTLDTHSEYKGDELYKLKLQYWTEVLSYLGVSTSLDKRERMLAGEVAVNTNEIEMTRLTALNARKQACRKINDMFGLNIDVEFNLISTAEIIGLDNPEVEKDEGQEGFEKDS